MTWEELIEKAKEFGYKYIKERGVEQLYKESGSCIIDFIGTSGNVVIDIPHTGITYGGILCERISPDQMYQIMLALR